MFSNLKAKISGYKTYIVAIIAILSAITAWTGNQISLWNALQTILAAIATCTMRAAVQKSQDAAADNVAPTIKSVNVTSGDGGDIGNPNKGL